MKQKYRPTWDLATIPEPEFKSESQRRRGLKGGRKKTDVDPKTRKRMDATAAYMRKWRKEHQDAPRKKRPAELKKPKWND